MFLLTAAKTAPAFTSRPSRNLSGHDFVFSQLFSSQFWLKKIYIKGKSQLEKIKFFNVFSSCVDSPTAAGKMQGLAEILEGRLKELSKGVIGKICEYL